jgi:hypothetical protein
LEIAEVQISELLWAETARPALMLLAMVIVLLPMVVHVLPWGEMAAVKVLPARVIFTQYGGRIPNAPTFPTEPPVAFVWRLLW